MATLLERVAAAAKRRDEAEAAFRDALVAARPACSWGELADVTGLSKNGVKYLVTEHSKGESDGAA